MDRKTKSIVIVLVVLLVLAAGYIIYDRYNEWKQQKEFSTFQQGAQFGYQQAVAQVFQQAANCKQVPIFYQNQTINIVAVECLQKA